MENLVIPLGKSPKLAAIKRWYQFAFGDLLVAPIVASGMALINTVTRYEGSGIISEVRGWPAVYSRQFVSGGRPILRPELDYLNMLLDFVVAAAIVLVITVIVSVVRRQFACRFAAEPDEIQQNGEPVSK